MLESLHEQWKELVADIIDVRRMRPSACIESDWMIRAYESEEAFTRMYPTRREQEATIRALEHLRSGTIWTAARLLLAPGRHRWNGT